MYIPEHDPELKHDSQDGDQRPNLKDGPEAPVELDEIFTVAVFDVKSSKDFENDADECKEKAEEYNGEIVDATSTDAAGLAGRRVTRSFEDFGQVIGSGVVRLTAIGDLKEVSTMMTRILTCDVE